MPIEEFESFINSLPSDFEKQGIYEECNILYAEATKDDEVFIISFNGEEWILDDAFYDDFSDLLQGIMK
tara:strand:+ start:3328 stop:3534 length:207 start_codon:yes stop_codon:yes gene_type:complete